MKHSYTINFLSEVSVQYVLLVVRSNELWPAYLMFIDFI